MYDVLDESGKVQGWLDAGRGLRVWVSHDIGAGRPDMLTPGDQEQPPHWAYPLSAAKTYSPAEVVFYRRVTVSQSWSDTPAGWRAARRHCPAAEERQAPVGRVLSRYTVEGYEMKSVLTVHMPGHPGRPPVIPATTAYDRPLVSEYRVGIMVWTAITPTA